MARSIIEDPEHVPQKKNKVIKELPNGRFLSKEMQKMAGKGFIKVEDPKTYNCVIDAMEQDFLKGGPFLTHYDVELYTIGNCVLVYDGDTTEIFATKDSPVHELTPEYWASLIKS
jgi:hypothetical protein